MLYALGASEIDQIRHRPFVVEFVGAEMLMAAFQTDSDTVARILPEPLTPAAEPVAIAFVARYPQTTVGIAYEEGALFVQACLGQESGLYCLAMPVTDDMAMVYGRETFGFPKKMADAITLDDSGAQVVGAVTRKGTEILRIELEPQAPAQPSDSSVFAHEAVDRDGRPCWEVLSFLFKFFPSPSGKSLDYLPRLIRQRTLLCPRPGIRTGKGRVVLKSSDFDPLGDIPVGRVIACTHGIWDNTMLRGRVMRRVWNVWRFLPHAFFGTDLAPVILRSTK
jgi:acetoacetate decarboxylase